MEFDWQPVEGMAYNLARHCDTPLGRVLIKQTRPGSRKYVVRIAGEVISRYEANITSAIMRAETEVQKRMERRGQK